jgi:hypothetical protein
MEAKRHEANVELIRGIPVIATHLSLLSRAYGCHASYTDSFPFASCLALPGIKRKNYFG